MRAVLTENIWKGVEGLFLVFCSTFGEGGIRNRSLFLEGGRGIENKLSIFQMHLLRRLG